MGKQPLMGVEYNIIFRKRQAQSRAKIHTEETPTTDTDVLDAREANITQQPMQHNPKVFNLSNRVLNETEIKLLSKGLKYTPTPRMNNEQLKTDIK